MLIHQLAKIAKEDESLRPHLLPLIREAMKTADWSPDAPSETGRVRDQILKELKRRGASCKANVSANAFTCEGEKWAIHGVWLEGPRGLKHRVREPNMQGYITDAANFIEENAPQGRLASVGKTARLQRRQEAILQKYLDSAGSRAAMDFDDLPSSVVSALRRVKDQETLHMDVNRWLMDNNNPHLRGFWASDNPNEEGRMASDKTAHGPVDFRDPDAMYYNIDPKTNKSKFYEMKIVPIGRESMTTSSGRKVKVAGDPETANWVLMRRWGRLTDAGPGKRVDGYNEYWESRQMAERSLIGHGRKRESRGYTDVTRSKEYPIGLGGAGFGWSGQAACRIIPELMELKESVSTALSALAKARREVGSVAREDSSMAKKLQGMIVNAVGDLNEMDSYLDGQLAHCR